MLIDRVARSGTHESLYEKQNLVRRATAVTSCLLRMPCKVEMLMMAVFTAGGLAEASANQKGAIANAIIVKSRTVW